MKRTYPQIKPVQASEIDRDGSAEPSKQTISTGRVRSLATIGLAISVGASGILMPRNGDSARASELAPTAESTAEVQPVSANGPATSPQVEGFPAEQAGSPSDPVAVKVQQGQTLWEVSRDYELEPKALATANGIKPDTVLQVGQELRIPQASEAAPQQNAGSIAAVNPEQKLNLTGSEPLDSAALWAPTSTAAPGPATTVPAQISIDSPNADGAIDSLKKQENRTTASGRTLLGSEGGANSSTPASLPESVPTLASPGAGAQTAIPDLWATPVIPNGGALQAASPESAFKSIEQSLATPSLPSAGFVPLADSTAAPASALYSVRPGDTVEAIASSHGVSPKELISANKLGNPNLLNVNQRLKIPQVGSNNPALAAAASDSASSTYVSSAASAPASFNKSSSVPEIASAGVAATAPSVPVVSPLANLEGLNNISAPMVPKINSIPLTQVSQTISNPGKLELQGEPTFTGAVDTSALPIPASATATAIAAGEYPQPVSFVSNAEPTSALPESNPEDLAAAPTLSPYAERLRAEVVRLREEYRAERNSIGANAVSLAPSDEQEAKVASGNPSGELPSLNPDLYTPDYAGAVQNEISRPPSRAWSEQVQKQQQERFDPARAAELQPINLTPTSTSTQERPVVATAPLGAEGYDPLSNPSLGRMVSPELPPLSGADTYLPNGSKQQSANGFIWPSKGVLTSGYGWRWGRMHKGIDIAGPIGTPIVAASDGVVTYAEWNDGGYGYLVEITHPDGSETVYAHNSRILVQKGQKVAQGEQISEMGSTGFSTGPHLHFEIHPAGSGAVNPMAFLPKDDSSASR